VRGKIDDAVLIELLPLDAGLGGVRTENDVDLHCNKSFVPRSGQDPPTESKISRSQSFEAVYLDTDSV
jgi:hypothetical protein